MKYLISFIVGVFILSSLLIGNSLYKSDKQSNITRDIVNYTSTMVVIAQHNCTTSKSVPIQRFQNIICSFSNFMIVTGTETIKFGIEFGYEHPEYNYKFYMNLVKWYIYLMILSVLIPMIIPLCAIFYIVAIGIKKLFNKWKK